jgi:uncharacterized protein with FMN-binding domain
MRRIVTWAMSTLTVIVLLFSYHTSRSSVLATSEARPVASSVQSAPSTTTDQGSGSAGSAGGTDDPAASDDTTPDASGSTRSTGSSGTTAATTFAGEAVDTRFGPVQVQITVTDAAITAVDVLQVPMEDRHDQMINSRAVPVYNEEAVEAQSADIDVVSGATVTWEGYTQSLQSAIDAAHL